MKIERDEQMKYFWTPYEPKMRSNIDLIGILERKNRENEDKEVILKESGDLKKKKKPKTKEYKVVILSVLLEEQLDKRSH